MYVDIKDNRILLTNGISLVNMDEYVSRYLREGAKPPDHIRVMDCEDSDKYFMVTGEDVGYDEESIPDLETKEHKMIHIQLDIEKFPRYHEILGTYDDYVIDRIDMEIEFFNRKNSEFIYKLIDLIDKFKKDGVIWGVGRGSACASVLLYIIEVHDLDPIKFDIPFSELSKEVDNDDDY